MRHLKQKYSFEKIGLNEVPGLEKQLRKIIEPLQKHLKNRVYWEDEIELTKSEYKSRDGFIPYSHNCGGLEIGLHLPRCESYEFDFIEWSTDEEFCNHSGEESINEYGERQSNECDEYCDGYFHVWLKFEGLDEEGVGSFYLVASGGDQDAPYFRLKNLPTIFEAEFQAKTMAELQKKGSTAIKKLIKKIGGVK